ncbi:MAG TPA: 16S rRNA (cytosine(1402)-N(4))-methyltransferase RsmH [Armatimonadota bacterium]|nr:16S rRNA (cytosine(1402)-N(4))-methyltransferase RsmH [Armatimonadota bacterium]
MNDTTGPHQRRPRYRGTHPRAFNEKYKELHPEQYPDAVAHVISRGDTPAGSHRPIMVKEILQVLRPQPGEIAVDATLGYGGHARELLRAILPGGRLYGLDVDPIELPKTKARLQAGGVPAEALCVRQMNFAALPQLLADEGLSGVDVVLADLGVSSMQIDNPARGFTFKREGPLDLRMNPEKGQPASKLLATISEEKLVRLLQENADEVYAEQIAKTLCERRETVTTTMALAEAVRAALHTLPVQERAEAGDDPIRRTFQALRIAVNQEFSALDTLLHMLPFCLNPGGRVAILTFHSGEDRRVKKAFQEGLERGWYSDIARTVLRASPEERHENPRSTSAKLRWAVRA